MQKYRISDELQQYINWNELYEFERCAGGHDDQMKYLFKGSELMGYWNEGDYQGMVATCVYLPQIDKFVVYNDYYGSCSGCDSWEDASDEEVENMCINLANGAFIFNNLNDVIEYLNSEIDYEWCWVNWKSGLLEAIKNPI